MKKKDGNENIFNKAFHLLNSKNIRKENTMNYCFLFEHDPHFYKRERFMYEAKSNKNYLDAINLFDDVIRIKPNHQFSYNLKGIAKGRLGDHRGSIEDFTKAIEIDPNLSSAYNNRGVVKGVLEDHEGAIEDFTKVIEIDSKNTKAYELRANIKRIMGDTKGAIEDYAKASKLIL